ncbi:C6 zinc finger domain protein [Aspergillus eucalypticola CBS 122712]|uniref:C6 zinc finger domain protein n=1 Tax=Aspergillus eucalypticola (strain CBS 122712 / IBT 29274) TaxID=1448314 RepID=A0A317UPJ7_ASPEC|nr:C6 zinc finger domain protein [Aspergillus eucalypticola CBS 122712]PWY63631.1 C6 zinc finger domain protein [Aspergillus eucalypticola CBS 122712]
MPGELIVRTKSRQRRRNTGKRSKTGCRTCRVRHIKCDEAPGSCRNCTSTGRACDGYDLHRFPIKRALCLPALGTGAEGIMTSDEKRGFSYFQYRLVPDLVGFFDSWLWQKLVLQMCHSDPAVCHAVNMVSAIHQDAEERGMRLAGEDLQNPKHRFALEQAVRSFAHLQKRRASLDPQLREVVLVCCLLFVMAELLLGEFARAFVHLRSGTRILEESLRLGIPVDRCLSETLRVLNSQSSHVGDFESKSCFQSEEEDERDIGLLEEFDNLKVARQCFQRVMYSVVPFIATVWRLPQREILANYKPLWTKRMRLLSSVKHLAERFEVFYQRKYATLNAKEQIGADIVRLQLVGKIIVLKTCLLDVYDHRLLTLEYSNLLLGYEKFMDKLSCRPTITLDYGLSFGLFAVASKCPDLGIRLRAVEALRRLPHYEGMMNSNAGAGIAVEAIKLELHKRQQDDLAERVSSMDQDPDVSFWKIIRSTQNGTQWSAIRDVELRLKETRRL